MFKQEGAIAGILIIIFMFAALFMVENPDWRPTFEPPPRLNRPEILIIRETTESHYGEQVLIVDYMVGGIATNAIFSPYQMDEYQAVMGHLKRSGRLRYATSMMEPLE